MRVVAITAALGAFPVTGLAQDAVVFLGSFDAVGSDVSVTPISEDRLEFCWTTTSQQSACQTFVYTVDAGVARFASFADGRFEFDLVTNVLTQTRPDGMVKTADMTPLAR